MENSTEVKIILIMTFLIRRKQTLTVPYLIKVQIISIKLSEDSKTVKKMSSNGYSEDLSEDSIIKQIADESIPSEKKVGLRCKILSKIFRQDEMTDSNPSGGNPVLDLSDLSLFGIMATTKFQAVQIPCPGEEGFVKAWFMEPEAEETGEDKVILYSHGVSNTRGAYYRVALYNVLLKEGFKVLAYDYRGFGDSSNIDPTESSVVQDLRTCLQWLKSKVGDKTKIVVWGHSMGAAITCHAIAEEFNEKQNTTRVSAVILEAPFNNMVDELKVVMNDVESLFLRNILKVFSGLGGLSKMTKDYDISFQSDNWICQIPCPLLVLAAEDDSRIPMGLTNKLVDSAKKGGKENLTFLKFEAACQLGHKHIYKSEKLPNFLNDFVNSL